MKSETTKLIEAVFKKLDKHTEDMSTEDALEVFEEIEAQSNGRVEGFRSDLEAQADA